MVKIMAKEPKQEKLTLENEIKKIGSLLQYKNKDRAVLEKIAQHNLWLKQISIEDRFESKDDKKLATKLLTNYFENYEINNYNTASNIADLVFKEIVKIRTQERISKVIASDSNNLVPEKQLTCLHDLEQDIIMLKEKTGISVTKDKDALNALEELQKKFAVYVPFHRNEYSLEVPFICKKCGHEDVQMHLIRRRCDKENFEVLKHPFFSGRFWFVKNVMDDYRDGIITVEQAARYMSTSTQYVIWANENRYKIIEIEGVSKQEVDEFLNKCPHLPSAEEQNEGIASTDSSEK
jgi:hypothetical protein